jgi:hypothetical protein
MTPVLFNPKLSLVLRSLSNKFKTLYIIHSLSLHAVSKYNVFIYFNSDSFLPAKKTKQIYKNIDFLRIYSHLLSINVI